MDYMMAEKILNRQFTTIKRWVDDKANVIGLEVYCAPILMVENVMKIKTLLTGMKFSINGNSNQSYILIKHYDDKRQN